MRLSEMSTDQLFDCLADITVPVANIVQDAEVLSALQSVSGASKEGRPVAEVAASFVAKIIPAALKTHRDDVLCVIGALSGKSVQTLREQNGLLTIKEAKDIVDKDLIDFFRQSADMSAGE